jgi:hypothetical protein
MSDEVVYIRRKLNRLADEAHTYFENAAVKCPSARWIDKRTWGLLSAEDQAIGDRLRHRLRQLLVTITPEIQNAPLLDKSDVQRLAKLGRKMDSALRFAAFRSTCGPPDRASDVFREANRELAEILDLVPTGPATPATPKGRGSRMQKRTPPVELSFTVLPPTDGAAPSEG